VRVRVKICGITRVEDALSAADAGADAIGLVFAPSPRRVSVEAARRIVSSLPPLVCAVGVFVDATAEELRKAVAAAGLHAVQLHGEETPEYAAGLAPLSVIKAIRVGSPDDVSLARAYESAAIMLDSKSSRGRGGTGETFAWEYARDLASERRVIISGGLKTANVAEAIAKARPWAVDVSTGVERSPGIKDAAEIRAFIAEVRRVSND